MALSDRDKEILDSLEASLSNEDPKLNSLLKSADKHIPRWWNNLLLDSGAILVGMIVLLGGLITKSAPIGVLGFVVSLVGLKALISTFTHLDKDYFVSDAKGKTGKKNGFNDRLEERWNNRNWDR